MKQFTFLKTMLLAVILLVGNGSAWGQVTLPHLDALNYTIGQGLQTQTGWSSLNSGDDLLIATGNLSYTGLITSTGNKVTFDAAGIDAAKLFTQQTSGTVYYSFLLNITSLGSLNTTGGYFTGFNEGTGTTFGSTVWTRSDGAGFDIGLNPKTTAANTVWSSGTTSLNSTIFIVVSYQIVSGTTNDIVKMWINPTPGSTEPTATLSATNGLTDLANVNRLLLRQDGATTTPFIEMDELRVGTTWVSVTPASTSSTPPTLTADATDNNVDNNIDITFTNDATWLGKITAVKIGGTALTVTTDYVISSGNIQLKPSGGNTLLRTAGSKSVTVEADGYSVASVTQQIDAGAPNKLVMKTEPAAPATNGAVLATQPAVYIQDQYGNTTTSTASVTAAVGAGTWTLGGTASVNGVSGTATFSGLTATSAAAVTGATISFTSGSLTGVTSGTFDIPAPPSVTPTITVTEPTVPAMSAFVGNTDTETLTVGGSNLTNNITFAITGTDASKFSYSPSSMTTSGGTLTITYTPTAAGSHTATLTISSTGAADVTRSLSGSASTPSSIIINEIDADQTGTDAAEFIELYDGGAGNTSLNGLVVVLFNGSDDKSYAAYDLDGYTTDANGYFVIGSTGMGTGIEVAPGAGGWLQNGADAVAIYNADASSFPNGTFVTTTNLIDALVYDTNDTDDAELLVLLNSSQAQIDENGANLGTSHSLQRLPNGTGGARNTNTYDQTYPTPGAPNLFQSVTWTGITNQVWGTSTNWSPNIVPDRGVNATITNVTNAAVIGADAAVNNLTISPNAKLTLNATFTLNVAGDFTIQSDASGTGTFLNNGTLNVTGATKVQQYLNIYRSWYMSSPVTGTTTPLDNITSLIPASLTWYDEAKGDPAGWTSATSTGMTSGLGYLLKPSTSTGASTITFTGTLNNGDKIVNLTRSSVTKGGFNLIGNPYPSHIVWTTDMATAGNLMSSIWYRTAVYNSGLGKNVYSFETYNADGTIAVPVTATPYIPPMQAFWVRVNATTDGSESLTFTNAMRYHKDSNPLKAPAASNALNQILRLQVSENSITDEAVIYFNDNAANTFDMYDSPKMMNGSTSTVPDLYTLVGSEELVINGMNNIPYNTEIPVYFKANASTAGTFTLKANEISNFDEGTKVYIKNTLTGDQQLISDGSDYTFNTADAILNPAFSLIFKAPGTVTGLANADSKVLVFANANRQIRVTVPSVTENGTISVYNAVGQKLYSSKVNKSTTVIDQVFTPGVYVVNINNVSKKVIIK